MIKTRSLVGSTTLLLAALATGCPGEPANGRSAPVRRPATPTPVAAGGAATASGEDLFKRNCSACHGPDAKGLPSLGANLVEGEFSKTKSDAELLEFVKKGRTADDPANVTKVPMPPKGGNPALKDAEIQAIIAHLRTLQGK